MDMQLLQTTGFVHRINPIFCEIGDVRLWYYGLMYAVGFLGVHLWFRWRRKALGWTLGEVYDFSILFTVCVLLFGRAFSVVMYQWDYYRDHLPQLFSFWRGGMASHGLLIGAAVGTWLFCRLRNKSFLTVIDEMVVPGAFFLACGRLGNFINGEIYGSVTNVWWGVKFPNAEGFRHPVTLYESLKNFAIVPILLLVRRKVRPSRGILIAQFVFWYGFLRIFTDMFREYGAEFLGLGRGQYFNSAMALIGLGLMVWSLRFRHQPLHAESDSPSSSMIKQAVLAGRREIALPLKQLAFAALLCFSLVIRSGWTEGVLDELRRGPSHEIATESGHSVDEWDTTQPNEVA